MEVLPAPLCSLCLDMGEETRGTHKGPGQLLYCYRHWRQVMTPRQPDVLCIRCDEKATHHAPMGTGYCSSHYKCGRCGQEPGWVYDLESRGYLCACFLCNG
jgi:hypothetical protein